MGIRAGGAAVLTAVLMTVPPFAQARTGPPLKPFPIQLTEGSGRAFTDGARYVVIQTMPGVVRVFDVEDRTSYDLAIGKDCRAQAATPGIALLTCPSLSPYAGDWPSIIRLRERTVEPVAGSDPHTADEHWFGIGRHWLIGSGVGAGHSVTVYRNWRTGARSSYPEPPDHYGYHDLDDPKLGAYPENVVDRDGSLALVGRFEANDLWLARSGADARLTGADRWPGTTQLSAGVATWSESNGIVGAYDNRSRVRLGWETDSASATISHTRKHVLVTSSFQPHLRWARIRK